MASPVKSMRRSRSRTGISLRSRSGSGAVRAQRQTVFDLLYDSYLPFRLYTDYMLGTSSAELARQFAVSEHWVTERIEAVRLCGKQVRLNLLDAAV
jgi:hypothetical protein